MRPQPRSDSAGFLKPCCSQDPPQQASLCVGNRVGFPGGQALGGGQKLLADWRLAFLLLQLVGGLGPCSHLGPQFLSL